MSLRRSLTAGAAIVALAGGAVAGCGAGTDTGAAPGSSAIATTVSAPVVTSVTTTTPDPSTLPGQGRRVIIADQNFGEQFIIGELYKLALEAQGYRVTLSKNLGLYSYAQQGLQDGSLDLYPAYLGSWNSRVARLDQRFQTLAGSYAHASAYARAHGFELLPATPFSDTWGLAVTTEFAVQNHVRSIPDLRRGTGFIIGATKQFETGSDGLRALAQTYGVVPQPGKVQGIDPTSQYHWLSSGKVTVSWVYTTDPQLSTPAYRLLADPKRVFGHGNVVPVTTPKVIAAEGPDFAHTIERVDALLTLRAMRGLNAEYTLGGHDPALIAEQFLEGNGILSPARYAPVQTATSASGSTAAGA